jgi:hypothetical protein
MVGSANAIPIDTFNDTKQTISVDTQNHPLLLGAPATEALGGYRKFEITEMEGLEEDETTLRTVTAEEDLSIKNYGTGYLSLSNDSGVKSVSTVTWDNDGSGLGGVDLTVDGADAIGVQLLFLDQGELTLYLKVVDNNSNSGELSILNPLVDDITIFSFDQFGNATNIDFTSVFSISLIIKSDFASDLDLDFIDTRVGDPLPPINAVPEPTTIALLGIGLAGIGCGYMRRRFRGS